MLLVELDQDHPGFRDAAYRARRNRIAQQALRHRFGEPAPHVEYTGEERSTWETALRSLAPLHERFACALYRSALSRMSFTMDEVPQLRRASETVSGRTGFHFQPVAGLVSPREFMIALGKGCFLATQYMRHHSMPLYTPEPDVIHELVGHAPLLTDPEYAEVNMAFGRATERASPERELALIRVYWYALEFGLVEEGGGLRALGAGLLSSFGELGRFERATLRPLRFEDVASTPFDPTTYQSTLFVAKGVSELLRDLRTWLEQT